MGVLNVRKESGWTSHDVVAKLRRLSGQRRVGHAGTLDPLAEGVLLVLFGRATRLADYVGAGRKRYLAEVQLGASTTTDDAEGEVVERAPLPGLAPAEVEAALQGFRGEIQQVPPAYSAVKVAGQRAYAVARRGGEVALRSRRVSIERLELFGIEAGVLTLDVACSRGTYVRSLARDLARRLGTLGHLRRLVRTEVGRFTLEDAATLEEIAARGVGALLLPPDAALPHAPRVTVDAGAVADLAHGRPVPATGLNADPVLVYDPSGRMAFVGQADGRRLRPRISFVPPDAPAEHVGQGTAGLGAEVAHLHSTRKTKPETLGGTADRAP